MFKWGRLSFFKVFFDKNWIWLFQLNWGRGAGCMEAPYSDFWNEGIGCTLVPWQNLPKTPAEMEKLCQDAFLDLDSLPQQLRGKE